MVLFLLLVLWFWLHSGSVMSSTVAVVTGVSIVSVAGGAVDTLVAVATVIGSMTAGTGSATGVPSGRVWRSSVPVTLSSAAIVAVVLALWSSDDWAPNGAGDCIRWLADAVMIVELPESGAGCVMSDSWLSESLVMLVVMAVAMLLAGTGDSCATALDGASA